MLPQASVRSSTQVTCRRSGAAMTLTRRITRSGGAAKAFAMTSGSAATVAAAAAWRRTEPSAQPVASSRASPKEAHDRAVTQDACATNDPTCTSMTMVISDFLYVSDNNSQRRQNIDPQLLRGHPVIRRPRHRKPYTQQCSDNCMDSGMGRACLQHAQNSHTEAIVCVREDSTLTRANLAARSLLSAAAEYSRGKWYLHNHTLPALVLTATSAYPLDPSCHAGDHATCTYTVW